MKAGNRHFDNGNLPQSVILLISKDLKKIMGGGGGKKVAFRNLSLLISIEMKSRLAATILKNVFVFTFNQISIKSCLTNIKK